MIKKEEDKLNKQKIIDIVIEKTSKIDHLQNR